VAYIFPEMYFPSEPDSSLFILNDRIKFAKPDKRKELLRK
jgi:hypothetical protein